MFMKIGILKECKTPCDYRVPFSPDQCVQIQQKFGVQVVVQPSDIRCFTDTEYRQKGIKIHQDLSDCTYIFGVKEVPIYALIPHKNYIFFSHTIKAQSYNQNLMRALIKNNITMIDYEPLVSPTGKRVGAFGHEAGIVGAYNALRAYGIRMRVFELPLAHTLDGLADLFKRVQSLPDLPIRVMCTGRGGRVSGGIRKVLNLTNLRQVSASEYLNSTENAVFVALSPTEYIKRTDGQQMDKTAFFANSATGYTSNFHPYAKKSDMYISGHFWDSTSPVFFSIHDIQDMQKFPISIISDVSCDVPGPVPTTLRSTSLDAPLYDISRTTGQELSAFVDDTAITVTAVDNLPSAIPRDSSHAFGVSLIAEMLPYIFGTDDGRIQNATICTNGALTEKFKYLKTYAGE